VLLLWGSDGHRLAVGHRSGTIRLWDIASRSIWLTIVSGNQVELRKFGSLVNIPTCVAQKIFVNDSSSSSRQTLRKYGEICSDCYRDNKTSNEKNPLRLDVVIPTRYPDRHSELSAGCESLVLPPLEFKEKLASARLTY
jgi:hypothetical protein